MRAFGYGLGLLALVVLGCESKSGGDGKLTAPVPRPNVEETRPEERETEPSEQDDGGESTRPLGERFSFVRAPKAAVTIKEGEEWRETLVALSPSKSPVFYSYRCPYKCPEGLSLAESGEVSWRPGYGDAGVYDIVFVAYASEGEVTTGVVRLSVKKVNRPPVITAVEVRADRLVRPSFLSCAVEKSDPDGDLLTTERVWYVNDVPSTSLTGLTVSTASLAARDRVSCRAVAVDTSGDRSPEVSSADYLVPNTPPEITDVRVALSSDRSDSRIRVGDEIVCAYSASDADGDVVKPVATVFRLEPGGSVLPATGHRYVVRREDAHKLIFCEKAVSDGADETRAISAPVPVLNAPPIVRSVTLTAPSGTRTGNPIVCEAVFEDPDGDYVLASVDFFNGTKNRGHGLPVASTSSSVIQRYQLRPVTSVSDPGDADIRGAVMGCTVTVADSYGAVTTVSSSTLAVVDTPPSLTAPAPLLSQSIASGLSLTPVQLSAVDQDGDVVSFEKVGDSCNSLGLLVSIGGTGLVTSTPLPEASYPQSDRACAVSYRANAGGASSPVVKVDVTAPNRRPTLTCTPLSETLQTAPENYQRFPIGAGEAAQEVRCTVSDPDGAVGGWLFETTRNDCGLTFLNGSGLSYAGAEARLNATMGLDRCVTKVQVSDGSLTSAEETIEFSPILDLRLSDVFSLDSTCRLSLGATVSTTPPWLLAPGAPTDLALSLDGVPSSPVSAPTISDEGGERRGIVRLDGLFSGPLHVLDVDWTMRADKDATFRLRTGRRRLLVSAEETTSSVAFPIRPEAVLGRDSGTGRQVNLAKSCEVPSSCPAEEGASLRSSLAAGDSHTCMVSHGGTVDCWGKNLNGQVGVDLLTTKVLSPVTISYFDGSVPDKTAVSVAAGTAHTCALTRGGHVACWGRNDYGQLGRGTTLSPSSGDPTPALVKMNPIDPLDNVVSLASGLHHTCALRSSRDVYCWGLNGDGQTGQSITTPTGSTLIAAKAVGVSSAVGVYAGGRNTCYVSPKLEAYCFGDGTYGTLGNGTYDPTSAPAKVSGLRDVFSLAIGSFHACALVSSGAVLCWGTDGGTGRLGLGVAKEEDLPVPTSPAIFSRGAAAISVGDDVTCAVLSSKTVECVGKNDLGQTGSATPTSSPYVTLPMAVAHKPLPTDPPEAIARVVAISVGRSHACLLTQDARRYCHGAGGSGRLGTGAEPAYENVSTRVSGDRGTVRRCGQVYGATLVTGS